MSDSTFIMSLLAIIISSGSFVFVIIKLGLNLGMEFVEKKEIRDMKTKIEDELKAEWEQKLTFFINEQARKDDDANKDVTKKEIASLGDATRHTQISSILLNVISSLSSNIIKYVILLILLIVLFVLSVWLTLTFPELVNFSLSEAEAYNMAGVFFIISFFMVIDIVFLRKSMMNYNTLRKEFYNLSEDSSLSKAKEIFELLETKELIYG